jgi:hypothetical protein
MSNRKQETLTAMKVQTIQNFHYGGVAQKTDQNQLVDLHIVDQTA